MDGDALAHVGAAVAGLLGLGLVMGFSPTLYGVSLHVLAGTRTPRRSMAALTAGLAIGATVLLLVFRAVDPYTWIDRLRGQVEAFLIHRTVDLAAAAAFVLTGAIVLSRTRSPTRPTRAVVGARRENAWALVGVGFANTVIGVSGVATMYVTGRVLTGLTTNVGWQAVAYLPFLVTLTGPYLVVAWAWPRMPAAATRIRRAYAWVTGRDLRPLLGCALLAAGVVFAVLGVRAHPGAQA